MLKNNSLPIPDLLLKVTRSDLTEREHFGYIVVVNKEEEIISRIGNSAGLSFFLRSCAKPFQAVPIIESGAYSYFNFSLQELAVCCASHTGTNGHIKLIKSIFEKIGLTEDSLRCGIHDPIDTESKYDLIRKNLKSAQIHNNCSGKHAGMLAICVKSGFDIASYLDFNHPLQKEILKTIQKFCNVGDEIEKTLDNCSAPVYGIPLHKIGVGFIKLFSDPQLKPIKDAFIDNPFLIGGRGRIDSSIIEATKGRLISKVGAEGLCVVVNPQLEQALVVKISDANMQARSIVLIEALKQLGWIDSTEYNNEDILKLGDLEIKTLNNILIGKINPVFQIK